MSLSEDRAPQPEPADSAAPPFDLARAEADAAAPVEKWTGWAIKLLPPGTAPDVLVLAAGLLCDAGSSVGAHARKPWQARGYAWQRMADHAQREIDRIAPDDQDAAVRIAAMCAVILQVDVCEAAKLQRRGASLTVQIEATKERIRREDQRAPQPHKVVQKPTRARGHQPRTAGRERRERRPPRPTRAGPDDGDGPARPPRPCAPRLKLDHRRRRG